MNINCTVIIQIGNFIAAWFLLEKILLKTILEKLNFKKKFEHDCLELIQQKKNEIHILAENQKLLWSHFNMYCKQNSPSFQKPHTIEIGRKYSLNDEINHEEVINLSQDYATRIISWLKDE